MTITYDGFKPLIEYPPTKGAKGHEYIMCNKCSRVMMIWHICYKKHLEPNRHILDNSDVCHFCWDKHLKECVEEVEAAYLGSVPLDGC